MAWRNSQEEGEEGEDIHPYLGMIKSTEREVIETTA